MNKTIGMALIAVVIVGGISFYTGTQYGKGTTQPKTQISFSGGMGGGRGMRAGGGFTSGKVLSTDSTSLTLQSPSGSTMIVLFGTSTQVMKTTAGALSDVTVGTAVSVSGATNSDGSVTAQNIQIRPVGMTSGFGGRQPQGQ